jgi:hypothetical protein
LARAQWLVGLTRAQWLVGLTREQSKIICGPPPSTHCQMAK